MKNFLSKFIHIHKWSKWEKIDGGGIHRRNLWDINKPDNLIGHWLLQERRCLLCGKIERNEVNTQ